MNILTVNPSQTKKIGGILAEEILKKPLTADKALIIGLEGDLGGGKTTFLQGFARGLGIKKKITSPTFVILKRFKIQPSGRQANFRNFYHLDCYRIEKPEEILNLGFKEIIFNSRNIVAVEWVDKIQRILPENVIILKFDFVSEKTRRIAINLKKHGSR